MEFGWTGEAFKSDYNSFWGVIKPEDIVDVRGFTKKKDALAEAVRSKKRYARWNRSVTHDSELYVVRSTSLKTLEAVYEYHLRNCQKSKQAYNESSEARITQIYRETRSRAKKKDYDFDLDLDDMKHRMITIGKCEVTGMLFDLDEVGTLFAPSVDRVDSSKGYTKDNVQVVTKIYNLMKSDSKPEALDRFVDSLARSHGFMKAEDLLSPDDFDTLARSYGYIKPGDQSPPSSP